jgi:hypothetical protein
VHAPTHLPASGIAFYAAAATVIPILMIAISVQYRADRVFRTGIPADSFGRFARPIALVLSFISIVIMATGEFTAFGALTADSAAGGKQTYVILAVSIGILLVALGTFEAVGRQIVESFPTPPADEHGTAGNHVPLADPEEDRPTVAGSTRPRRNLLFGRYLPHARADEAYMATLRSWWRDRARR